VGLPGLTELLPAGVDRLGCEFLSSLLILPCSGDLCGCPVVQPAVRAVVVAVDVAADAAVGSTV